MTDEREEVEYTKTLHQFKALPSWKQHFLLPIYTYHLQYHTHYSENIPLYSIDTGIAEKKLTIYIL